MTMSGNATATTIATPGVAVKAAGVTALASSSQKFIHSDNRLTYTGALTRLFRVTGIATFTGSANNVIGTYVAKNGAVISVSESYSTANTAGRAENVVVQVAVELATNDYVEIWVENETAANNVTVTNLSVIAEALN